MSRHRAPAAAPLRMIAATATMIIATVAAVFASGGPALTSGRSCDNVTTMMRGQANQSEPRRGDPAALTALIASYDTGEVDVAVTATDHRSGVTYRYNDRAPFETASIVKVGILATLQLQYHEMGRSLSEVERELAKIMIEDSDNDAASRLWSEIGAENGFAATAPTLGLTSTAPGTEGRWGTTRTTSDDQDRMLQIIADVAGPLPQQESEYLLSLLREVRSDQSWGISAAARDGEQVMIKNGWFSQPELGTGWAVNSIGRITGPDTELTLVVLSRGHSTMSSGIGLVEEIAKATREYLAW